MLNQTAFHPVIFPLQAEPPSASRVRNLGAPEDLSDERLMSLVSTGDRQAFDQLSRRHALRIYRLAVRLCRNDSDAQEISQEALIRVWNAAPRWKPEAKFTTWLYRVVMNLCFDRGRKPVASPLEEAGDPPDTAQGAFERVCEQQCSAAVARALEALPERQRIAVVLTYYQEVSNAEAAAIMGVSVSALEALLVRARRTLSVTLAAVMAERRG